MHEDCHTVGVSEGWIILILGIQGDSGIYMKNDSISHPQYELNGSFTKNINSDNIMWESDQIKAIIHWKFTGGQNLFNLGVFLTENDRLTSENLDYSSQDHILTGHICFFDSVNRQFDQ